MVTRARAARIGVALLAVCLAAAALSLRSSAARALSEIGNDEDRYYLPPPSWLRAFSLGYNEAAADLVWVKTIIYFGDRVVFLKRGEKRLSAAAADSAKHTINYLSVVTRLDPRFRSAYVDGARLTLYHKGIITRRSVEMAIDLLERGIAQFPNDGETAFTLGFLKYYELPPFLARDAAAQAASREAGARQIRASASMEGAPAHVALMAPKLLRREGLDDLVIEHLKNMLLQETDPGIRASLEVQLRREVGAAAERNIATARELEARWRKDTPYAPFDLFLLVQPEIPWSARGTLEPWTLGADEEEDLAPAAADDDAEAPDAGAEETAP